ncbi:MAG TPA: lysophospholipid acyltransferase family protein [Tepidisphaeraceae bacterium]|nr:lysophospholipid acyltransferase family protein [Tepidisphaeraceae bacterium]
MAKKNRIAVLDYAQYVALRVVAMLFLCFPVNTNLRTAKLLGSLLYKFDRKHRERALANLRRSFPEKPEGELRVIAERSMQELFMLFVEVLFTTRLIRIDTYADYVELEHFEPVLELLLKQERGLLMLTAHYGNFEILGYTLATLGFATSSIARPLDNQYISDWLFGVREKMGQEIITKKGATEAVVDVLDQKGAVGIVADQNAGSKGVFVDFFGRKASTYKSIGLVAMQYEVPIVIGYARRMNDQFKFHVGAQDIIYPKDWANEANPLHYITQRYNKAIEDFIRADPGQYWWVHRRWKTRPKGEEPEKYD